MNDFFTTSDTCEASSILASGVQIERMEKSPNGRVHFYFPDHQKAAEVSKQFWSKSVSSQNFSVTPSHEMRKTA